MKSIDLCLPNREKISLKMESSLKLLKCNKCNCFSHLTNDCQIVSEEPKLNYGKDKTNSMVHPTRARTQSEIWKFLNTMAVTKKVIIRNDKEKVKRKKTIS